MKKTLCLIMLMLLLVSCVFSKKAAMSGSSSVQQLEEITEFRKTNSETYRMSDGTFECVIYADDKYYAEGDEFIEIDNSVVSTDYKYGANDYSYTNAANSSHFYFADDKLSVLIAGSDHLLEFYAETDSSAPMLLGGLDTTEWIDDFCLSGKECVCYKGVFDNTDVVYQIKNDLLKEYIVLNNSEAPNEFAFSFNTENYYAEIAENGTVAFYDLNGKLVFELDKLFAVDSRGAYTEEVSYSVDNSVDNKTLITVSVSEEYLHSPDREFPILIDPSVVIYGTFKTADSYVSSKNPTTNYYTSDYIRMGWDSNYYVRRTYISFDLSGLPSGLEWFDFVEAYMSINKHSCGNDPELKAYRVTGSWSSSTITWNNKPGYTTTNSSNTAVPKTNNWYRFNGLKSIVYEWYSGTYPNYGLMITNQSESGTGNWSTFFSSDASSKKPQLRVRYKAKYFYANVFIGEYDGDMRMIDIGSYVGNAYYDNNYYGNTVYSSTKTEFINELTTKTIVGVITHGFRYKIRLTNDVEFNLTDVSSISDSDLTQLKLLYFGACSTASGGANSSNLVNAFYNKGVDTVVGFTNDLDVDEGYLWSKIFLSEIASGQSIADAKIAADDAVVTATQQLYQQLTISHLLIRGSDSTILCPN